MNPPILIFGFSDESPCIDELVFLVVWAVRPVRPVWAVRPLHQPVGPVRPEPATQLSFISAYEYENISSQLLSQMLA
jgi:hypothetical protein